MKSRYVYSLMAALAVSMLPSARAGTFTDNFNVSRDYKANGVAGTRWVGITAGTNTPSTVASWNANISTNNTLTITNTGGAWQGDGDGPFLWTMVKGDGDFTNKVRVSDMSQVNYHMAGLMVRDPNSSTENFVMLSFFGEFNLSGVYRDVVNGANSDVGWTAPDHVETNKTTWANWLQITRVAGVIDLSASTNNLDWFPVYTSPRTDLTNDLQVGIMNSTYLPNQNWAQYQNFSLEGPGVPSPTLPNPATALTVTPQVGGLNIAWTAGAGSAGSVVVVRQAGPVTRQPLDGTTYSGSNVFGSGNNLGESNYVAHVGAGTSVTLTNVTPTIPYTVAVYSYTGTGASTLYGITNAPSATAAPFGTPTGITVSLTGTNTVAVDDTMQAAVTLFFSGGGQIDVTAQSTFSSSNTNVASVSASGLASGLSAGVTTITANHLSFSATTNLTVVVLPVTENFSTPKNYLTESIAGTPWHGLMLGTNDIPFGGFTGGGLGQTFIANAGITKAGRFTVQSTQTGFDAAENDGFFLYRIAQGDFSISAQLTSFNNTAFHMPGLMARAPFEFSFTENSLALVGFNEFNIGNFVRDVTAGVKAEVAQQVGQTARPFIMIERQTNTFRFYQKLHALDAWTLISTRERPDLDGVAMQVGIVDQNFTGNTGTAEFDNLVFTGTAINSPNAPSGPTGLSLSSLVGGQVSASWTAGAGSAGSIVVAHPSTPASRQPADGSDYSASANADLGLGFDIGGSNIVVFAGAGTSVVASNLPPYNYSFTVYSYATVSGTNYYNILSPATSGINVAGIPIINPQPPAAITRYNGLNISIAAGASPATYSWLKGVTPVSNGGGISGATSTTLSIASAVASDSGSYALVATTIAGATTSSPTVLTILAPTNSSELSVLANGPSAFWRLTESSGTLAADYVGGYDGTHQPGDVLSVDGPRPVNGFAHFEANNLAAQFTGNSVSNWVLLPALTTSSETVSNLTITAWIKPTLAPADRAGIVSFTAPAETGFRYYGGANGLSILWNNTVGHTTIQPPVGQWSFVAMVVRPTGGSIYLATNGGWQVYNDAVVRPAVTLSGAGYIGSDRLIGGRYFEGSIDEVAVYRTALSASQITNLFTGVVTPPSVTISIQKIGSDVQLSWPQGTLLESTNVLGPWTTNGAASPLLISNPAGNKFFKVQVQ
jgi:regulation of enolase protein 1 (concanavalin A-like superfamily)